MVNQPDPKVIRRPKLVVSDSGLACHLLGVTGATLDRRGGPLGQLLEMFVVNEIRKQLTWSTERATLWHSRDRGGAEVDLVLEHADGRICGIEVKATSTPRAEDLRGVRYLADRLGDRFQFGVLLTAAARLPRSVRSSRLCRSGTPSSPELTPPRFERARLRLVTPETTVAVIRWPGCRSW